VKLLLILNDPPYGGERLRAPGLRRGALTAGARPFGVRLAP